MPSSSSDLQKASLFPQLVKLDSSAVTSSFDRVQTALAATLQESKNNNKEKSSFYTGALETAVAKLKQCESDIKKNSKYNAMRLAEIPERVLKVIQDDLAGRISDDGSSATAGDSASSSTGDSNNFVNSVLDEAKTQEALLAKANDIQNVALHDGEIGVAEDQMWTKIDLIEKLIEISHNAIGKLNSDGGGDISLANQNSNTPGFASFDADARRQISLQKVAELKKEQQDLEAACQAELKTLDAIAADGENEDHSQYRKLVELTIESCAGAIAGIVLVEEVVNVMADAVKARFGASSTSASATNNNTNDEDSFEKQRLTFYQMYLDNYRTLILTLGSLLYKKQNVLMRFDRQIRSDHINLEFCVDIFDAMAKKYSDGKKEGYKRRQFTEEEIAIIKDKMNKYKTVFEGEIKPYLVEKEIEFNDPFEENTEEVAARRKKMLEYRRFLNYSEKERAIKELNELDPSGGEAPSNSSALIGGIIWSREKKKILDGAPSSNEEELISQLQQASKIMSYLGPIQKAREEKSGPRYRRRLELEKLIALEEKELEAAKKRIEELQ